LLTNIFSRDFNETTSDVINSVYNVPEERKYNNLSVDSATQWVDETVDLPPISSKSRLQLVTAYDNEQGAAGLDNIKVHTQQK